MFGSGEQAYDMGASPSAPPSTSARPNRAPDRKSARPSTRPTSSAWSPCSGATCATTPSRSDGVDYHTAADLTGQANHLGVTIEADIIKQKLPENNGGFDALKFGKTDKRVYSDLTTDHPIDLTRYQVVNCYMGRSRPDQLRRDLRAKRSRRSVKTAVINKRAGGMGLISGRKAFQRP
jgi:class I fructose-bisphosphate aldolase